MSKAGASLFTFHVESEMPPGGISALISSIRSAGMAVGLCVKPGTPIDAVYDYADDVDLILIMTVVPGFSGQKFMEDCMVKVKALRERCPNLNIEVDGGLSPDTVDMASEAGANVIVAASAIFKYPTDVGRGEVIRKLRDSVDKAREKKSL